MRSKNFIVPLVCLLFAFCLEMPLSSTAMNVQVLKGDVSLVEQKEVTKIHASDDSIIQYSSFDIQEGAEVKIVQPSENSILVIQINSKQPTRIKSKLSANGHVYIVNPNGVFIDKTAEIEKGSFYFIGSELLNDNVKEGLNIKATSGDVINHGVITSAGQVHLVGRHVVNSGKIAASELVKIAHTNAKDQLSILHTGTIQSKYVFIEAREGVCEIYGKIDAKNAVENQYGGSICILGQHVRLIGAYIDASGTFKGGQINIGGPFEGKGNLFKATRTSVDNATIIDASAIEYGHGGEVVLWSEELTSFQGEIFAKGGRKYGAGGRVETSSLNHLGIFTGKVNVDAVCGEPGSWMLDPSNIVISDEEGASTDLSLVTEFPAKSGSQVTISVKAINSFSGGKLQIAASNRITIDANIENISSTIDLTFRAGNQIRFKNEQINVPNGKIAFIIDNQESGQVICTKDFKGISAHQMTVVAPRGGENGFIVETNSLVLNPSNAHRADPQFIFDTDVVAKNNSNHQLYFRRAKNVPGTIIVKGSLLGFDFLNSETNMTVTQETQVAHLITKGATQVQLLGGGYISELAEFENIHGLVLGDRAGSHLKINGGLNTTATTTKLCGTIDVQGSFEANDLKLLGNTVVNTHNNPIIVHQNITQDHTLANLALHTGDARITVEGSVFANNFLVDSKVAPALCGEVCVCDLTSNSPELSVAHDFIVSGQVDCRNLTTSGENKKIAFAKGGVFRGKTIFNHSGTTTLGVDSIASFHFEDMLDTHKSATYAHALIQVQGPIEMRELTLLGDTSLECDGYTCNIAGSIEQQECEADLNINTKNEQIGLNKHVKIEGLSLKTSQPLNVNVPMHVTTFVTTSPYIQFQNHLFVDGTLSSNNLSTEGVNSRVAIIEGAKINGSAEFNNEGGVTFGKDADSTFVIQNRLSCRSSLAKIQGVYEVYGQVDLLDVELCDHTRFNTHGHPFNVERDVSQYGTLSNFEVVSDAGSINLGKEVYVNELKLDTMTPVYVPSRVEVLNLTTTSPFITFANDTYIKGTINSNSLATLGRDKQFHLSSGGSIHGDAKFANTGLLTLGDNESVLLELQGPFDRANGETLAQGTLRTYGGAINLEELSLSGKFSVMSLTNDGHGETISFHSEVNGAHPLIVNAGNSKVYIEQAFGRSIALSELTIYSNELNIKSDITLNKGVGEFYSNIYLANNVKIEDSGKEGLFFYGKINGDYDLNVISNKMIVVKKDIGGAIPLNSVNLAAKRIDVWASIAANSGAINFDGNLELCEHVKFVNCGNTGICFNGKVDGDYCIELKVNDKNGKISFNDDVGSFQAIRRMALATQNTVIFNRKLNVDHFETNAPKAVFYSDVVVAGQFNVQNVLFDGARQNVSLMGGGTILGNATFNNKGDLFLGSDSHSEFNFGGIVSRIDGPTYAQGTLNTYGVVADFSALHTVGDLKMISHNPKGTSLNFNGTIDGAYAFSIDTQGGSIYFYDYIGNLQPLSSLNVNAKTVSMQKQMAVKEGDVVINADLYLLNHSSIRNMGGKQIAVLGSINGEWDLALYMDSKEAKVHLAGVIGDEYPINRLTIDIPNSVELNHALTTFNLSTTAPTVTFKNNVEVKQQLAAVNVVMDASDANFTVYGGGYLKGNLELNNTKGITTLGDSSFSSFTTEGRCSVATENVFAQGLIQSMAAPMTFEKVYLNGPLKIASNAQKSADSSIHFYQEVVGGQAFEVDAGDSTVSFAKTIGDEFALQSISVRGSNIALGGDINLTDGGAVFAGDVVLNSNLKIQDQGKGAIAFLGNLDGAHHLDVINKSEGGHISFAKAIGSKQPLKNLHLDTQNEIEFPQSVELAALNTSSPSISFGDEVTIHDNISAHHMITKGKYRMVRLLGTGNFSGMSTFAHSGSLVLGNNDNSEFNFSGPLSVQECVLISQGKIKTEGSVTLAELSLKGNTSFDTQGNSFKVQGIVEPINEHADLSIEVGSGQIAFGNKVEAYNLKVNTALPIQFNHPVLVMGFETKAPHVIFANNVSINGPMIANDVTTLGADHKVKLLGGGVIKGNTVFRNGNGICLGGNDHVVITFYGPLDTTTSLLETRGTIETVGKTIDIGNLSIVGNTTIRSISKDSDGKNIYFLGLIEGPKQLRANAGKAIISFEHHIGSKTALESLQVTASRIEVDGNVNSNNGNVVFAGDVVFTSTANLSAQGTASIIFQGTVNADGKAAGAVDLFLDATGKIEFQKDVGDVKGFNEVVVTRAGELVCRSPLKSNIITQGNVKPLRKIEAKAEDSNNKKEEDVKQNISQSKSEENVHQS